jgi:hypothetical protein
MGLASNFQMAAPSRSRFGAGAGGAGRGSRRRRERDVGRGSGSDVKERAPYHECMAELVFEVIQESDGRYCAECLTESIFTEAGTWEEAGSDSSASCPRRDPVGCLKLSRNVSGARLYSSL